jgi:hypothetical protein
MCYSQHCLLPVTSSRSHSPQVFCSVPASHQIPACRFHLYVPHWIASLRSTSLDCTRSQPAIAPVLHHTKSYLQSHLLSCHTRLRPLRSYILLLRASHQITPLQESSPAYSGSAHTRFGSWPVVGPLFRFWPLVDPFLKKKKKLWRRKGGPSGPLYVGHAPVRSGAPI